MHFTFRKSAFYCSVTRNLCNQKQQLLLLILHTSGVGTLSCWIEPTWVLLGRVFKMLYFGAIISWMAMALYQSHLDRLWLKVFAEIFQFACHFLGLWHHCYYRNPLPWLLLGPWLLFSRLEYIAMQHQRIDFCLCMQGNGSAAGSQAKSDTCQSRYQT